MIYIKARSVQLFTALDLYSYQLRARNHRRTLESIIFLSEYTIESNQFPAQKIWQRQLDKTQLGGVIIHTHTQRETERDNLKRANSHFQSKSALTQNFLRRCVSSSVFRFTFLTLLLVLLLMLMLLS